MSVLARRPTIVHYVVGADGGGPLRQLGLLQTTLLAEKFNFRTVSQERATGGVNLALLLEMSQAIRHWHPDLVHVRGLLSGGFYGLMAARLSGCRRVLVSVHGITADSLVESSTSRVRRFVIGNLLEPMTLQLATGVYCVCHRTANHPLIRRHARNFSGVIPNGIRVQPVSPVRNRLRDALGWNKEDVVGLFVGRIVRAKGLFDLAEALQRLSANGQNQPQLMIAGDGPDFSAVQSAFRPLILKGRVRLLGTRTDIAELHAASDFFVFPTLSENLSNAILEAMHGGRAVLATRVGGNPEVVDDGVTGQLIPPGDPSALARALQVFSGNAELRNRYGMAGRHRVETCFSIDQVAQQLDTLYTTLLRMPRGEVNGRQELT